jgi:hypothetical protein
MKVVSNTSPIINLAGVDSLDLLFKLYGNLIIPAAVFYEIAILGAGEPGCQEVPRLFLCKNRSGQHYLALSVEEDENLHRWLYVAMSKSRLHRLRVGQLELRDAYMKAEDGMVFKVVTSSPTQSDTVEWIFCHSLPAEWLPVAGEYLSAGLPPQQDIPLDHHRVTVEIAGVVLQV